MAEEGETVKDIRVELAEQLAAQVDQAIGILLSSYETLKTLGPHGHSVIKTRIRPELEVVLQQRRRELR